MAAASAASPVAGFKFEFRRDSKSLLIDWWSSENVREARDFLGGMVPEVDYLRICVHSERPIGHLDILGAALPSTWHVVLDGHADDLCALLRALRFQPMRLDLSSTIERPVNLLRAAATALERFPELEELFLDIPSTDIQYTNIQAATFGEIVASHRALTSLLFTDPGDRVPARALYSTLRKWGDGDLRVEDQTRHHRAAMCRVLPHARWKVLQTNLTKSPEDLLAANACESLREIILTDVAHDSFAEEQVQDLFRRDIQVTCEL